MPKLADRPSWDTHYLHTFINCLLLQCNTWIFQSQLKLVVYKYFSELIWHNFCSSHTALICDVDFDDYILQLCDTKIGWLLNMWHLMRSRITRMAWFKLIKCKWSLSLLLLRCNTRKFQWQMWCIEILFSDIRLTYLWSDKTTVMLFIDKRKIMQINRAQFQNSPRGQLYSCVCLLLYSNFM